MSSTTRCQRDTAAKHFLREIRRKTMFLLNTKKIYFTLSYFVFFACLTTVFAEDTQLTTEPEDTTEVDLDLEKLLAAIKQTNGLIKSGEGEFVYTDGQPPFDTDTHISTGRVAFTSESIRFDSPRSIAILTPAAHWEIDPDAKRRPNYFFSPGTQSPVILESPMDPRQWLTLGRKDLATHLREKNFHIKGREFFNGTLCYVLEAKQGDMSEKIWIAPERGFRYLKHESQFPRPVDALDSDIPMEALTIDRTTISYQQLGEIWFPKAVLSEYAWLDFQATYPIISRQTLEVKDFKVNHTIPPETFTVDLPDDAMVRVNRQTLSKEEFLKQYEELLLRPTVPIKDQ